MGPDDARRAGIARFGSLALPEGLRTRVALRHGPTADPRVPRGRRAASGRTTLEELLAGFADGGTSGRAPCAARDRDEQGLLLLARPESNLHTRRGATPPGPPDHTADPPPDLARPREESCHGAVALDAGRRRAPRARLVRLLRKLLDLAR